MLEQVADDEGGVAVLNRTSAPSCCGSPAPAADVLAALIEHVRPALADTGDPTAVVRAAVEVTTGGADRAARSPTD
jgi:hypothetical protein